MNKHIITIGMLCMALDACNNNDFEQGSATVNLRVSASSDIVVSRSEADMPSTLTVEWVGENPGEYTFSTVNDTNNVQTETMLPGSYVFNAFNYASEALAMPQDSRGNTYYYGTAGSKTIANGVNYITIVAGVANALVNVNFASSFTDIVTDYSASVYVTDNSERVLTFSETETDGAWFPAQKSLKIQARYTYGGKTQIKDLTLPSTISVGEGSETFTTLKAAYFYTFTIGSTVADGVLNLTVNSTLSDAGGMVPVDPTIDVDA